jgi:hypothetical protein
MTPPIRIPGGRIVPEPLCGKGTKNGEAARVSRFGFAACVLREGHPERECDSGPVPDSPPPKRAA